MMEMDYFLARRGKIGMVGMIDDSMVWYHTIPTEQGKKKKIKAWLQSQEQ